MLFKGKNHNIGTISFEQNPSNVVVSLSLLAMLGGVCMEASSSHVKGGFFLVVVDATSEVFLPATHRKCSFPGQQLISADRVLIRTTS